jgi:hypothetical protein
MFQGREGFAALGLDRHRTPPFQHDALRFLAVENLPPILLHSVRQRFANAAHTTS